MKTVFYLVRHGQSQGNDRNLFAGRTDVPLSDLGKMQAQTLADSLKNQKFDALYASDLSRARDTASPFSTLLGLPVRVDAALREEFVGDWEGLYIPELREKYPFDFNELWCNRFVLAEVAHGESPAEAACRFLQKLSEIALEFPGGRVIVCAHAAVIRAVYATVSGLPAEEIYKLPWPNNASISTVSCENGVFSPIAFSDDSALVAAGMDTPSYLRRIRYAAFEETLGHLISEGIAKLGESACDFSFHLPWETVKRIFPTEIDELGREPDVREKLEKFAEYEKEKLGKVSYVYSENRVLVTVPREGAKLLAQEHPASALLLSLIEIVKKHGSRKDVHKTVSANGGGRFLPSPNEEFDEIILPNAREANEVYCFEYGLGAEYHRFERADFETLFPGVLSQ